MASNHFRTRKITPELKKQISNNNIYVCERHFKDECISIGECTYTCILRALIEYFMVIILKLRLYANVLKRLECQGKTIQSEH